jgi:hypothetical protein
MVEPEDAIEVIFRLFAGDGRVRDVQVIPSGEVNNPGEAPITKVELAAWIALNEFVVGTKFTVQLVPSVVL